MKVGLALGGGGDKGFAHIGVIRALEEAGLRIDVVAGTSVGAPNGSGIGAATGAGMGTPSGTGIGGAKPANVSNPLKPAAGGSAPAKPAKPTPKRQASVKKATVKKGA